MKKPRIELVQSQSALAQAAHELADSTQIFVDTEFESTRSEVTLCLLQLSRGETLYVIDTLRLPTLDSLVPILGDRKVEWVLHAGQQDVGLLMSRFRLKAAPRIFDTQVAWALVGPEYSVSLAYLVYRLLGIRSGKAHQADDWKRRPLPESQLAYAASDIVHLPELRRILGEQARALGREEIVLIASKEAIWPDLEPPAPLTRESFRNAWQLDAAGQAALNALIHWYNELEPAQRLRAPEPKTLLAIAGRAPETVQDLSRIKGVSRSVCADYGDHLVALLREMRRCAHTGVCDAIEPLAYATFEEIRMDGWLAWARAEVCAELSVAPELALPSRVLKPLKAALLQSRDLLAASEYLGSWRKALLMPRLLAFAQRQPLPF